MDSSKSLGGYEAFRAFRAVPRPSSQLQQALLPLENRKTRPRFAARCHHPQTGFATFLPSLLPPTGSTNSLQLTGTMRSPPSLSAITTPSSFFAVLQ